MVYDDHPVNPAAYSMVVIDHPVFRGFQDGRSGPSCKPQGLQYGRHSENHPSCKSSDFWVKNGQKNPGEKKRG
jgi:hypothetical protein